VEAEKGACATAEKQVRVEDPQTIKGGRAAACAGGFDSIQEAVRFINDGTAGGVEAERGACATAKGPIPEQVKDAQTIEDGTTTAARAGGVRDESNETADRGQRPTQRRQEKIIFEGLMEKPLGQRLSTFEQLAEHQKILMLYPQMKTTGLPARDKLPDNWENLVKRAHEVVKEKIEKRFEDSGSNSDEESDSHSECGECGNIYSNEVIQQMTGRSANENKEEKNQQMFLDMAKHCLPIIT
jgi:hypothetical protein